MTHGGRFLGGIRGMVALVVAGAAFAAPALAQGVDKPVSDAQVESSVLKAISTPWSTAK